MAPQMDLGIRSEGCRSIYMHPEKERRRRQRRLQEDASAAEPDQATTGKQCDELKWQQQTQRQTSGSSGLGGSSSSSGGSNASSGTSGGRGGDGGGEQSGHSDYMTMMMMVTRREQQQSAKEQSDKSAPQRRSHADFAPARSAMHFADPEEREHVQRNGDCAATTRDSNNNWRASLTPAASKNTTTTLDQNLDHDLHQHQQQPPVHRSASFLLNQQQQQHLLTSSTINNNSKGRPQPAPPSQDFYYSDSTHYLESTLPLNQYHCQQQQQQHPFGTTSYELAQMQQQQQQQQQLKRRQRQLAQPEDQGQDQHLYCAVSNTLRQPWPATSKVAAAYGPAGNHHQQQQQLNHHYQIPGTINHKHLMNHNNQLQQQQPFSIYKSPTSMTLNQSYQTLVEKLNENRLGPASQQFQQQQQQPIYSNNLYSTSGQLVAAQQHFHQQPPQLAMNSSPIFSSITTTTNTNSAANAPSATTPPDSHGDRYLVDKYLAGQAAQLAPFPLTHGGHKHSHHHQHQHLKWAFATQPHRWCRLLLLLLLVSILLLVGIFIVSLLTTSTTNTNSQAMSQNQLANIPNGLAGGGGPNEFSMARFPPLPPLGAPHLPVLYDRAPVHQPLPPGGVGDPATMRTLGPFEQAQQPNVIMTNQDANNQLQSMRWPASLAVLTTSAAATTSTTTMAPTTSDLPPTGRPEVSTQAYWAGSRGEDPQPAEADAFCRAANECNGNGQCEASRALCACAPGFSGPTCLHVDCPNECSRRGRCVLRPDWPLNNLAEHSLDSLGFPALGCARAWQLSMCAARNSSSARAAARPQAGLAAWYCECAPGFTGPDCGQARELSCQDGQDNDADGLADCEDDDCCAQPSCRDNLMCYQPPEPARVLERRQSVGLLDSLASGGGDSRDTTSGSSLFAQWSFLIANGSVQSYAQRAAFVARRAAIVRGRVLNSVGSAAATTPASGVGSVRVSVLEAAALGFTLTRSDGQFDMLVNGDEWLTLQFLRVAYAPAKRRVFVRAQSITVLDDHVPMWLASAASSSSEVTNSGGGGSDGGGGGRSTATSSDQQQQQLQDQWRQSSVAPKQMPAALALGFELAQMIDQLAFRAAPAATGRSGGGGLGDDHERKRAQLFECLFADLMRAGPIGDGAADARGHQSLRPTISASGGSSQEAEPSLRTFALVSRGSSAFTASLRPHSNGQNSTTSANHHHPMELLYNSAHFGGSASVVKPGVVLQLLPRDYQASHGPKLAAIELQLNIEGQTRRERLEPSAGGGLQYQFAWNRRNAYGQKVYGYGELNVRVSYEFNQGAGSPLEMGQPLAGSGPSTACLDEQTWTRREFRQALSQMSHRLATSTYTYEGRVFVEAHQMNQHADVGKWALAAQSRLDPERNLLYLATGWTLPFALVYPPVVSEPLELAQPTPTTSTTSGALSSKLLARGPHSSVFVALVDQARGGGGQSQSRLVQLDSASGKRRLLDVPLSVLVSKLTNSQDSPMPQLQAQQQQQQLEGLELLYNDFESALYLSSRLAGRIVRVSLASLSVLNRTLASGAAATLAPEDEIDIEPLCGFSAELQAAAHGPQRQQQQHATPMRSCKSAQLGGPHSLALDERNQLLYFVDGPAGSSASSSALMVLNLNTNALVNLSAMGALTRTKTTTTTATPFDQQQQQQQAKVNRRANNGHDNQNNHCLGLAGGGGGGSKLALAELAAEGANLRSLAWSRADSTLYFVLDQRAIVALRQDSSLEIVALGAGAGSGDEEHSKPSASSFSFDLHRFNGQSQPNAARAHSGNYSSSAARAALCHSEQQQQQQQQHGELGAIKEILVDDSHGHELLVLHKWTAAAAAGAATNIGKPKVVGRFYLAKLALGIQEAAPGTTNRVFDLHSARSTWNPLVVNLARGHHQSEDDHDTAVAADDEVKQAEHWQQVAGGTVTFLAQVAAGFDRVDSLQLNSEGTIFLLDQTRNWLRLLESYSPARFNQIKRPEHLESARVFGGAPSGTPSSGHKRTPLTAVQLRNPIKPREVLEFHAPSGLLLSRETIGREQSPRLDFYYRIFAPPADEELNTRANSMNHDLEDDENDLQVQRIVREHQPSGQQTLAYVRLSSVLDASLNKHYELVRARQGPRHHIKSIQLGGRPICEMSTDRSGALTTFVHQPITRTSWTELVYEPKTYLLQNVITKTSSQTTSVMSSSSANSGIQQQLQYNNFPYDDKLKRLTRRILYDEMFNHYCDLFTVDA